MKYLIKFTFFYVLLILYPANSTLNARHIKQNTIYPGAFNTSEYIKQIREKKVGVVANFASVIGNTNLIDSLLGANINVVKIFAPEHGFGGKADAGAIVDNQFYGKAKIPVISLYGKSKKPASNDLSSIDIIVFDLQDVGVRFYTYISTLHYVMEACAENNKPLLVLDRPNPNGYYIDGPVLDPKFSSFIGMHPVPIVYGLTIGEYAQMINGQKWLNNGMQCNLQVIKCLNYTHKSFYDIPTSPSPNLKDSKAIALYPSTALFEGTIVSEGRGTDAPFLIIGHPDFSDHKFSFTPNQKSGASVNPKLNGKICYGLDLRSVSIDDVRNLKQIDLNYLLLFYNDLKPNEKFFIPYFEKLAGTDQLRIMILEGKSIEEIRKSWKAGLDDYKKIRVKYLLYPDFE
jgi:uncharacterized protein YbbC (DUF1343 family)